MAFDFVINRTVDQCKRAHLIRKNTGATRLAGGGISDNHIFVALEKGEFIGRAVLAEQKASGPKKKLVAFKMTDKSAPPRPHYPIWVNGASVGEVVSGTQSPSLNLGIGMGYVPAEFAKPDTKIEIEIRGKRFAAVTVKKPIYKKGS